MIRKVFPLLLIAFALSFSACNKDKFDDLQKQIDDLEQTVEELEANQQAALEAQIATLMAEITALQAANTTQDEESAAEIAALLVELEALQTEVETNQAAVYYGDVTNPDQYAAFTAQVGATIITGNVIINTADEASALSEVVYVAGNVDLNVIASFNVTTIGGNLDVNGFNTTGDALTFSTLSTVGGYLNINNNDALTTFTADQIKYLGGLYVKYNPEITALSLASLTSVTGDLEIDNNVPSEMMGGDSEGKLVNLNINGADVLGKATIKYIPGGDKISIGNIGGELKFQYNGVKTLEIIGTEITGVLTISYNLGTFEELLASSVLSIGENAPYSFSKAIDISSNGKSVFDEVSGTNVIYGLKTINFDNLEYIGAKFNFANNKLLVTELNTFNKVTEIGSDIYIANTTEFGWINIFNGLVATDYNITLNYAIATNSITAFNALATCKYLDVEFITPDLTAFTSLTNAFSVNKFDVDQVTTSCEALNVFEGVQSGWNFKLYANTAALNSLCSMQSTFDLINAGTFVGNVSFYDIDVLATDNAAFITAATAGCL